MSINLPAKYKEDISGGELYYIPDFLERAESDLLFQTLHNTLEWRQDRVFIAGEWRIQPRLSAWYGDPTAVYTYSGLKLAPMYWTEELRHLKNRIELTTNNSFNSVLCNMYRDGTDSMGWHADNEKELGVKPIIASISLGEVRTFKLKHKVDTHKKLDMRPEAGSLLIMSDATQENWLHAIPKTKKQMGIRINLTFRNIVGISK